MKFALGGVILLLTALSLAGSEEAKTGLRLTIQFGIAVYGVFEGYKRRTQPGELVIPMVVVLTGVYGTYTILTGGVAFKDPIYVVLAGVGLLFLLRLDQENGVDE